MSAGYSGVVGRWVWRRRSEKHHQASSSQSSHSQKQHGKHSQKHNGNGVSTNLFLALGDADGTATGLTVGAAADKFYILAYDNDNAFLYFADDADDDNTTFVAADVLPIAQFDSSTAFALDVFDGSDFVLG